MGDTNAQLMINHLIFFGLWVLTLLLISQLRRGKIQQLCADHPPAALAWIVIAICAELILWPSLLITAQLGPYLASLGNEYHLLDWLALSGIDGGWVPGAVEDVINAVIITPPVILAVQSAVWMSRCVLELMSWLIW